MSSHFYGVQVQVRDQIDDPKFEHATVMCLGVSPNTRAKLMVPGPDGMDDYDTVVDAQITSRGKVTTITGTSVLLSRTMRVPAEESIVSWELTERKCKNC